MKKKILLVLVLVVAAILAAAGTAYVYYHPNPSGSQNAETAPITGTLVGISTSTITVASEDDTQRTFKVTPMTPVISTVASGQIGQALSQLSVGITVTVTPKSDDPTTAVQIELAQPVADTASLTSVTGTVVSTSTSSITLKTAGPAGPTAMPGINTTVLITKDTTLFARVAGEQTNKLSIADISAGTKVTVVGTQGTKGITAQSIADLAPPVLSTGVNTTSTLSIVGMVVSTSASGMVLQAETSGKIPTINITVLITKTTALLTNNMSPATLPLKTKVRVTGTLVAAGVINAQSLQVVPAQ